MRMILSVTVMLGNIRWTEPPMPSKARLTITATTPMTSIASYERKTSEGLWEKRLIYVGSCEKNALTHDTFQDKDHFIWTLRSDKMLWCNEINVRKPDSRERKSYLPCANVFYSLSERSTKIGTQFKSIAPDFYDVVKKSAQGSKRKSRREQNHIAKLYEHLQVVLERVLREAKCEKF